jgi:hypothetical protein
MYRELDKWEGKQFRLYPKILPKTTTDPDPPEIEDDTATPNDDDK